MSAIVRTTARCGLVLLALWGAGAALRDGFGYDAPRAVRADVRESKKPAQFQSGGARSELVLREISATLKQMDSRLQRIEKAALQLSRQQD